jgi:2-oxoglutarate ferredoxin oxidoreductase subunit delta
MTSDFLPQIDTAKCTGCELCVKVCPKNVLAVIEQLPVVVNPEACDYRAACQEICPTGAISLTYEIVI